MYDIADSYFVVPTRFRGMAEHDPDPHVLKVVEILRVHREYDCVVVTPFTHDDIMLYRDIHYAKRQ